MKVSQFNKLSSPGTGKVALVDFYADWCGPCHTMNPILNQIAKEYHNKINLIKVDVDRSRPIAEKFNIKSIPTLVLINNSKVIWRKSGLVKKSDLKSILDKSIK